MTERVKKMVWAAFVAGALALLSSLALAQTGSLTTNAVPYGLGEFVTGFGAAGPGTTGQVLGGNTAAAPSFQSMSSVLDSICTTTNAMLYRNATNWVCLDSGGAAGVLAFGGTGIPAAVAVLPLNVGGTNANLTASTGGIVYSTGGAMAILAGTATANQVPLSGSSAAPAWSTATYPATAAQGALLSAVTANAISGTVTPVLGNPGSTKGTLGFAGNTSGTVTIQSAAAAGTWTMTLPVNDGDASQFLQTDGAGVTSWVTVSAVGNVVGPASATDNAVARFDSTTGKLIQDSALIVADTTGSLSRSGNGGIPLQGTNTNDSAAAGYVGEFLSSSVASGAAVSLVSTTAKDITTLALTAGDWDVWGQLYYATGGTTVCTSSAAAISLTLDTFPTPSVNEGYSQALGFSVTGACPSITTGIYRASLAGTTTFHFVGFATFTVSTAAGFGQIMARRVR